MFRFNHKKHLSESKGAIILQFAEQQMNSPRIKKQCLSEPFNIHGTLLSIHVFSTVFNTMACLI